MKTKTIKLFGIIMMLVMGMSFNACSSDDDDDDGGGGSGKKGVLVGNWYRTFGGQGQMLYTFYSNGEYKYQEWDPVSSLGELSTDYGTWKYIDGDLILTEDGDEDKEYYTVKWLGDDEIKLTDDYGDSDVFERVDFSKLPKDNNSVSGSEGNIVGNWYYEDEEDDFELLLVLQSNGSFKDIEREVYNGKVEEYVEFGTWTYKNGVLTLRYEDGWIDDLSVRWITSNKVEVTFVDEYESFIFTRVSYSTLR